ncbi:MAG TPA: sulfur carrier protein ThiS adenylyltransferase ThiF [Candidatus Wallbacteria bacterium]|nr:sulfur carrier protein ThiS adenylyltransferase ThiF [Candidatus Wallbacteria bacterium]
MSLNKKEFYNGFYQRNPPGSIEKLKTKKVGIAGAGGLGSNIAGALVRSGIQNLVIADFDTIEVSNLNRQNFFHDQIGRVKVEALKENLLKINPFIKIKALCEMVDKNNAVTIFGDCDILIEAFDRASAKVMLVEAWMERFPEKYIVIGSGLAGYGMNDAIKTSVHDKLVICGDQKTESNVENGLIASRVLIVAAAQANAAVEILLNGKISSRTHDMENN